MWSWCAAWCRICFFFQAEDGIRDYKVTGVQTCALPISVSGGGHVPPVGAEAEGPGRVVVHGDGAGLAAGRVDHGKEIGRASCRERVEMSVVAEEITNTVDGRISTSDDAGGQEWTSGRRM